MGSEKQSLASPLSTLHTPHSPLSTLHFPLLMSTFEDDRYQWRETYFVLFDPAKKPLLHEICKGLDPMFKSLQIRESLADEQGRIESLSVASYDDFAAIDLIYQCGDHVIAETNAFAEEMLSSMSSKNRKKFEKGRKHRARLDVLHFEQMESIRSSLPQGDPVFTFATFQPPAAKGLFAGRPKFQFDPDQYIPPPEIDPFISGELEADSGLDDEEIDPEEKMDPNTLILVLELLCRLTGGIAIDPASGGILNYE